uniref:PAX-interacting protein 1 n=1 Tax=Oncorhynchus mykiss TaxID=8022 RepID=A0A8C7UK83_ONCMY
MSGEEPKVPEELFKDVKFYVVGDIDQKVVQLLKAGKGKEVSYNALATHIIAEDGDNPEVGESREVFDLPVVKPSWVTLSVRCGDLLPVTGFSPESGQIFFGVTACLPKVCLPEDLNTLWALVTFYGGDCQLNLNKKCTHLIVPEPKGEKYEVALKHSSIKIVTPEWITHSALDKSRKDEALYHPRLTYQEVEEDEESEYESLSEGSYSPPGRRRPGPRSRRSSSSSRDDSPASGRGGTSPKAERRDELMFDDSDDSSTEKEERNLNWTPVEITGAGPPDTRGMAGWSPAARTLRNITNNSDIQQTTRPSNVAHVRILLSASTKTLEQQQQQTNQGQPNTQPNPLLFNQVKPQGQQQLTAEAQQQLLQQQSHQVPQQPQQHPPQQLPQQQHPMLQVRERLSIIQAYGGIVDSSLNNRCTHLLCETQVSSMYVQALREGRRCVTAHWLNTILKKKKMVPPHRTLHLPFAFPPGAKPCSQHIISVTGFVDSERDDLKLMAYLAGARYTGYLCRSNTVLICKEPSGLKYEKAKEWRIPCVNAQWLCDILLGNFEVLRQVQHSKYSNFNLQEPLIPNQHLVQNLLGAWRAPVKVSPDALAALQLQQKQKQSESNSQHPNKKPRLEEIEAPTKKLPPESTPYIFFTGFEPTQVQQFMKRLYNLGGEIAKSAQKCTHLVANKVTRTVKFLTAISIVEHIVTPEWLEESWKSQKFVDEQNYMLKDAEAEVLFGFSLEESLKRAHAAPLFKGKYFYITPGICPSLTTMKAIIESAGGKVLPKQPSFRKIMEHKQNKNLPEIILISCENDLHLCREYFLKNIDVHNAEFILTGVLTQNLDYESYPFKCKRRNGLPL